MTSLSLTPDQIAALNGLVREIDGAAVEVEALGVTSIIAMVLTRLPGTSEDDGAFRARFFSISPAGSIRERAGEPVPEAVAA